jgi:hypothetical protein
MHNGTGTAYLNPERWKLASPHRPGKFKEKRQVKDIPHWLPDAIRDLNLIADGGNLKDLQFAFAADCRASGGLPSSDERARQVRHLGAGAVARAREIGGAMSMLFGLPRDECERLARQVLVHDPWSEKALGLIREYRNLAKPEEKKAVAAKVNREFARSRRR